MEKNQILAALQIESDEVRLVVGEFYNDVLYIIAKESVNCKGINGLTISESDKVIEAIREAANNISVKLKTPLQSVLLCIPGYRSKRTTKVFNKLLDSNVVRKEDIKKIFDEAYSSEVGQDSVIVNVACANYKINGITYPKMPLNEKSELLQGEVDIITGDKLTAYDYVTAVNKAGLKVIDIYQDGFASSAEAALFEQSFNNYVVNIHLEGNHTVYSLIYNGRLVSSFAESSGYSELIKPIVSKYRLSYKDASRLMFRYGKIAEESGEDRVINRWNEKNTVQTITYDDIQKCIYSPSVEMIETFNLCCSEILKRDNVSVLVTGRGAELQNLAEALSAKMGKNVICYCPDTLGVRESKWSALLGMFYIHRDYSAVRNSEENSVDMIQFKQNLVAKQPRSKEEGESLTSKFKNLTDKLFEKE